MKPARITDADYDALPGVRWSHLKEMRRSPLQYMHATRQPRADTDALRLGRATHCAVLEPDVFPLRFAVWTGGARRGGAWTSFCEANADRTILTEDQYERAICIRDAVRLHPAAAPYLRVHGLAEHAIAWVDDGTGTGCKARIDWLTDTALVDLKTARNIESRAFGVAAHALGYAGQMAYYRRGVRQVTGAEPAPVLIAVESMPPHDVAVYELDEDAIYAGDQEVDRLLDRLRECQATGMWPGRYPTTQQLQLPKWAWGEDSNDDGAAAAAWLMGDE